MTQDCVTAGRLRFLRYQGHELLGEFRFPSPGDSVSNPKVWNVLNESPFLASLFTSLCYVDDQKGSRMLHNLY